MLCVFILLTVCTASREIAQEYKMKSIEFIDVASECYATSVGLIKEFEIINSVFVDQIMPMYENSTNTTEIRHYIDFVLNYTETLANITKNIHTKYLNKDNIKDEDENVIKVVVDVVENMIKFLHKILMSKSKELLRLDYEEYMDNFIREQIETFPKMIVEGIDLSLSTNFTKIYSIGINEYMKSRKNWSYSSVIDSIDEFKNMQEQLKITIAMINKIIIAKYRGY